MSDFVLGQRWVVDSEPELGLGIVVAVEARSVSIFFPLGDTERLYSINQAPLTRIVFSEGEELGLHDGSRARVSKANSLDGLAIYTLDDGREIPETQVSAEIELNQPFMRLMTGQLDKEKWFFFRRALDAAMAKVWNSQLSGLLGVRADLIPHQLYVAHAACEHEDVRVLLADEVGLGKTIEAGMILNRLLKQERVKRALIIVPDALQVQWLVELVRRFSLHPSVYVQGEEEEEVYDFSMGQLHILPHSNLLDEQAALLEASFDMVIVDESHHLSPGSEDFELLAQLAGLTQHMVLVTATPEQLGFEGHFARLQLLDPEKYTSLESAKSDASDYAEINALVRDMPQSRQSLIEHYSLDASLSDEQLVDHVLDCHGVGRVMFRNLRASVAGFPERIANVHALNSDDWEERYEWLAQFLKQESQAKVLCICHHKERVLECESYLWQKHGIDAALFHEDMNLIERDRAAAYFADDDRGTQVLLCSEIGSEGRNFQFCEHLVCLDLPEHPDLLEQRIGRLDRIGQIHDVNIHVAFAAESDEARRWHWFHDVLECVEQQNPAASSIHDDYWPEGGAYPRLEQREAAHVEMKGLRSSIALGRDALLEMNSCRQPMAAQLADNIRAFEQDSPLELVSMASELLNFHFEELGGGLYSIIPADNMMIGSLPGIPPEGAEMTFERALACSREDVLFMTWDSPFVTGLWELLHHSELGSACVALLPSRQLPAGKCLVEGCFDLVIQSPLATQCLPYLKEHSLRVLSFEGSEKDLSQMLAEQALQDTLKRVDKKLARKIIQSQKDSLPAWFAQSEAHAEKQKELLIAQAVERVEEHMEQEYQRYEYLLRLNQNLDKGQLEKIRSQRAGLVAALKDQSLLQLSAIRLIVTTEP